MKKLLIVSSFLVSSITFSQGINFGFSSGTQLFKLEAGYSVDKNIHFGLYFTPGFEVQPFLVPMSIGGFGRYTFDSKSVIDNSFFEMSIRPFLGANLGVLHTKERVSTVSIFDIDPESEIIPAKTQLGYSVSGGVELLYGRDAAWGTFFEFGVGKSSNYFNALTSNLTVALDDTNNEEVDGTGVLSFCAGFRFYF